ncbi:MAG: PepSY-like domain-containing protein, partial [Bacteroidales bacterium]|nr:PepSY-like domain-containing protein [Bacteroidales bacterium]
MQRFVLFIIVFLMCGYLYSQTSEEITVPDKILKSFNRRFPRAEDVSWNKVDTAFKADFYYKERLSYVEYSENGEWVMSIIDQDIHNLYPPIDRYLKEHYKKHKILFVEKAVRADKNDYYYAQLSQKVKGKKKPVIIELFFDKTGRIEQVKQPEGMDDMTIPGIDEPETVIPGEVTDSWKKRFPRAEELSWTTKKNESDSIDYNY